MKKNIIKRIAIAGMAAVSMLTAIPFTASAAEIDPDAGSLLLMGHNVTSGVYDTHIDYKYSDGFFEIDPYRYQPHMATMSMTLAHNSCTKRNDDDYSHGPDNIFSILESIGFTNCWASDSYYVKPTTDSVACAFGIKDVQTAAGMKKVISITIRSANYEKEWASNVTLGKEGEAAGFANAADQVIGYLQKFINQFDLQEMLDKGQVSFWITGFSRGGATANLAAKRLVDAYQAKGNQIYAYCLEAPQGGVKSAEQEGSDYRCIHNVINPDDLVPYVAPTAMGFKRYGVDHYLNNVEYNSDNLIDSVIFDNNISDNLPRIEATADHLNRVKEQIRIMVPNTGDQEEVMPFTLTSYHINASIGNFSFDKKSACEVTHSYLNRFTRSLVYGPVAIGNRTVSHPERTTRSNYTDNGVETALRHLMEYLNSDADLKELIMCIDDYVSLKDVISDNLGTLLTKVKVASSGSTWDAIKSFFTGGETKVIITLNDENRKNLAESIVKYMKKNPRFLEKLNETFPGKSDAALKDISALIREIMKGVTDLDDIVTLVKNVEGIIHNHSEIQTAGWLRASDSWFDDSVPEDTALTYQATVQGIGWTPAVLNGDEAGTTGKGLPMSNLVIKLNDEAGNSMINYRAHVSNIGWMDWQNSGTVVGAQEYGQAIEALEIKMNDAYADKYDIVYRVHMANKGWGEWSQNGEAAGTVGECRAIEAIQIKLVEK